MRSRGIPEDVIAMPAGIARTKMMVVYYQRVYRAKQAEMIRIAQMLQKPFVAPVVAPVVVAEPTEEEMYQKEMEALRVKFNKPKRFVIKRKTPPPSPVLNTIVEAPVIVAPVIVAPVVVAPVVVVPPPVAPSPVAPPPKANWPPLRRPTTPPMRAINLDEPDFRQQTAIPFDAQKFLQELKWLTSDNDAWPIINMMMRHCPEQFSVVGTPHTDYDGGRLRVSVRWDITEGRYTMLHFYGTLQYSNSFKATSGNASPYKGTTIVFKKLWNPKIAADCQ